MNAIDRRVARPPHTLVVATAAATTALLFQPAWQSTIYTAVSSLLFMTTLYLAVRTRPRVATDRRF